MHGLGRTWPNYVGWAQPSPCEQCPPLFTCYVNSGGKAGTKQEKKEGEKGWPTVAATVVCATGGDRRRRWRFAVLFFFSLSILCFTFSSLLLLLSAFPLSFLFFLFSSLLCPLSSVLAFFSLPPCFYRQKQGRDVAGRPLCCRPKNCLRNTSPPSSPTRGKLRATGVGKVGVFFKREMVVTEEEKSSSSPASRVQGKKRTHNAFKLAPFWVFPFFLMNSVWNGAVLGKTCRFI